MNKRAKNIVPRTIKRIPSNKKVDVKYSKSEDGKILQHTSAILSYKFHKIRYSPDFNFSFVIPDSTDIFLIYSKAKIDLLEKNKKRFEKMTSSKTKKFLNKKEAEIFDNLIVDSISIPIMLYSALESFANQQIFLHRDNFPIHLYPLKLYTDKKGIFYDYFGLQRYMPLKDKVLTLIPKITRRKKGDNISKSTGATLKKLSEIRNAIIHSKDNEENGVFQKDLLILIENILHTDWKLLLKEVEDIIENYKGPNDAFKMEGLYIYILDTYFLP